MNNELKNQLMLDEEIIAFLKAAILEKHEEYVYLLKIREECPDSKIDQILSNHITGKDICFIYRRYDADVKIKRIEVDLANMCYCLNNNNNHHHKITNWERAYEYATSGARIENVVRLLTGEDNFNRNIKCFSHDDAKTSLKVYTKNNRFVCFGCGIRGSPIDFVMQYKNCPFNEAVLFLSNI